MVGCEGHAQACVDPHAPFKLRVSREAQLPVSEAAIGGRSRVPASLFHLAPLARRGILSYHASVRLDLFSVALWGETR